MRAMSKDQAVSISRSHIQQVATAERATKSCGQKQKQKQGPHAIGGQLKKHKQMPQRAVVKMQKQGPRAVGSQQKKLKQMPHTAEARATQQMAV